PSTLNPQPSTLNPQPSTLNPQPSTLYPQPSTLNPQPSTLNPNPEGIHGVEVGQLEASPHGSQGVRTRPQLLPIPRSRAPGSKEQGEPQVHQHHVRQGSRDGARLPPFNRGAREEGLEGRHGA
ncbi:hypothetical protein T484DRAFT_3638046, partial [Baffinella frigidus]